MATARTPTPLPVTTPILLRSCRNNNHNSLLLSNHKVIAGRDRALRVSNLDPSMRPSTPKFIGGGGGASTNVVKGINVVASGNGLEGSRVATEEGTKKRTIEMVDLTQSTSSVVVVKRTRTSTATTTTTTINNPLELLSKPTLPVPAPTPTTTTTTAMAQTAEAKLKAKKERIAQHEKMTADSITWRQKYKKAFPSFVFYFDAVDTITEMTLVKAVDRLGASVDNFFSKKVTHVVTSRSVPTAPHSKENMGSPAVPSTSNHKYPGPFYSAGNFIESAAGPSRTRKSAGKKDAMSYSLLDGQKFRPYGEGLDRNPFIDSQDILSKASEFGLKIWRLDKAQKIIARINSHSPTKVDPPITRNLSLPSLLRDEQLFGTRERDPFVPRADTHYFPPKSYYVLVEDSTGEHRPIAIKEYDRPRKGEDPSWPVLYGGIEGRGGFYHYQGSKILYERKKPPVVFSTVPIVPPAIGFTATRAVGLTAPNLRRSVSLNQLRKHQAGNPQQQPSTTNDDRGGKNAYVAASGNSQIITSNIASGTSTRSGAIGSFGMHGNGIVDKRLAILSRSVVSLGGGSGSTGSALGKLKRSASVDAGLNKKVPPPREECKKPGYCENCRVKYDDFKDHIIARRHRKFARNPANWVDLDELLSQIRRPKIWQLQTDTESEEEQSMESGEDESSEEDEEEEEGDSGFYETRGGKPAESNTEEEEDEDEEEEEEEEADEDAQQSDSSQYET